MECKIKEKCESSKPQIRSKLLQEVHDKELLYKSLWKASLKQKYPVPIKLLALLCGNDKSAAGGLYLDVTFRLPGYRMLFRRTEAQKINNNEVVRRSKGTTSSPSHAQRPFLCIKISLYCQSFPGRRSLSLLQLPLPGSRMFQISSIQSRGNSGSDIHL